MHKKESLSSVFLVIILVTCFVVLASLNFDLASSSTNVPAVINSDTTWTKSDSPYTLGGNTIVANGATLTIQPGATVELGGYNLQVNGTLRAIGTDAEKIIVNNGEITFSEYSKRWDENSGSGSILENVNLYIFGSAAPLGNGSPSGSGAIVSINAIKINKCNLDGQSQGTPNICPGNSSIITNNRIIAFIVAVGNCIISNNNLSGGIHAVDSTINNNYVSGDVSGTNLTISGNTITNGVSGSSLTVKNNNISVPLGMNGRWAIGQAAVSIVGGSNTITNNILTGGGTHKDLAGREIGPIGAVDVLGGSAMVSDNTIYTLPDHPGITQNSQLLSVVSERNVVNFIPQPTPDPDMPQTTPNPTQQLPPSTTPPTQNTQNPTMTPNITGTQSNTQTAINWEEIAVPILIVWVAVLSVALLILIRKQSNH